MAEAPNKGSDFVEDPAQVLSPARRAELAVKLPIGAVATATEGIAHMMNYFLTGTDAYMELAKAKFESAIRQLTRAKEMK